MTNDVKTSKDHVPLGPYMSAINITPPGRKTEVWEVLDRHDDSLGSIEWYGAWRQYVFIPDGVPVFNGGCLTEIVAFLASLMAKRRQK